MRTIGQLLEELRAARALDVEVYKVLDGQPGGEDGPRGARAYGATFGAVRMTIGWDEFLALRTAGAPQVCPPKAAVMKVVARAPPVPHR